MSELLDARGPKKWIAAQLTIDESTGLATSYDEPGNRSLARLGFWAAGISVYIFWNLSTAIGYFVAGFIDDPLDFGVDAAIAAAFLALLWPRLKDRTAQLVAGTSVVLAIVLVPVTPIGVPVLACSFVALFVGLWVSRGQGK
jgi:predicted branched-subunit amino acid permease